MTDEQWRLLEPEVRAVMAELRKGPGGTPMSHDLRAMVDAIGYVTRYGIEWRALPVDFHLGRRCMRSPNAAESDVPGPPVRISQTHKKPGDDE
ncbi:MAG TPA: transposase [Pseudonocardia sp.]|uniref:transposase n=1 Tax=Pseudonocardia sp. TaxID=60912 RepID=UPI002F41CE73